MLLEPLEADTHTTNNMLCVIYETDIQHRTCNNMLCLQRMLHTHSHTCNHFSNTLTSFKSTITPQKRRSPPPPPSPHEMLLDVEVKEKYCTQLHFHSTIEGIRPNMIVAQLYSVRGECVKSHTNDAFSNLFQNLRIALKACVCTYIISTIRMRILNGHFSDV